MKKKLAKGKKQTLLNEEEQLIQKYANLKHQKKKWTKKVLVINFLH